MAAAVPLVAGSPHDGAESSLPLFRLRRSCQFEELRERASSVSSPTSVKVGGNRTSLDVTRRSGTLSRLRNRGLSIHRSQSTTSQATSFKRAGESSSLVDEHSTENYPFRRAQTTYESGLDRAADKIPNQQPFDDVLKFADYGAEWSSDVIVLPHNALRSELRDLLVVVRALNSVGNSTTQEDVALFCNWWSTFASFGIEYFDYEERILFPCAMSLTTNARWTQLWSPAKIMKRAVLEKFQALDTAVDDIRLGNANALNGLEEARIMDLSETMLKYFAEEEKIIPDLLSQHMRPDLSKVIQSRMAEHFCNSANSREHVVLLTYWMRNKPSVLQSWCSIHLPLTARLAYPRWKRKFEAKHRGAITKLERRASAPVID